MCPNNVMSVAACVRYISISWSRRLATPTLSSMHDGWQHIFQRGSYLTPTRRAIRIIIELITAEVQRCGERCVYLSEMRTKVLYFNLHS